jgi:flagellar M-ring protein FliF
MPALLSNLRHLTPRGRIALGAAAVLLIVVPVLLFKVAARPSYTTLMAGMDPAQTGKVTAALDEAGIGYELRNGGTALAVDSGRTAQARIALAQQGLPGTGQPGFELFDKQKLGASEFQQQVDYQRALEGEIAKTISQIQGVGGAQVQLVLPQDDLFADEKSKSRAAVLLSGGAALEPGAVRGIAQLVSSSVKGLAIGDVTITDGTGRLLWPSGEADGSVGADSRLAAERRYSADLEGRIGAMLVQTLGAGKSQVRVNAVLDASKSTQDKLTYAKKGVPLKVTKDDESLRGSGAAAGGRSGTGANVPSYTGAAAGGGNSNYRHRTSSTEYGVDKVVTRSEIPPGAVQKVGVAVMLDTSVPAPQVAAIKEAVASAAGIDPDRGDTLSVSQVAFVKPPAAAKPPGPIGSPLSVAKYAAVGLGILAFLVFMLRELRRRERDQIPGDPTWIREITAPVPLSQMDTAPLPALRDDDPLLPDDVARRRMEDLAEREPERIAQQVRAWMADE